MATYDAVFAGKLTLPEVSTGPVPPGSGPPPSIWDPTFPTPPIYIQLPPVTPPSGGAPPEIWIPVFPTNPIVIPGPGRPIVWPPLPPLFYPGSPPPRPQPTPPDTPPPRPQPGPPPVVGGGPVYPPEIWPGPINPPTLTPPIYIRPPAPPVVGGGPVYPPEIWVPVFVTQLPVLPPAWLTPPAGAQGFWGYSVHYGSPVFVPSAGERPGAPPRPDAGLPPTAQPKT